MLKGNDQRFNHPERSDKEADINRHKKQAGPIDKSIIGQLFLNVSVGKVFSWFPGIVHFNLLFSNITLIRTYVNGI